MSGAQSPSNAASGGCPPESYAAWRDARMTAREGQYSPRIGRWNHLISVVLFGGADDAAGLQRTLMSLRAQRYRNIEVIVAGIAIGVEGHAGDFETLRGLFHQPDLEPLSLLGEASHDELWRGDYLTFARAGTEYDADGFSLVNDVLDQANAAPVDLVVIDHDHPSAAGPSREPVFLPGWDPDLVFDLDCIGTAFVASRVLVKAQRGGQRPASLHDWLKRICRLRSQPATVHVSEPIVRLPDPAPQLPARATPPSSPWDVLADGNWPRLAIVVANRNRPDLLTRCLGFLAFPNRFTPEIVIVDNASDDPQTWEIYAELERRRGARIVRMNESFNYARMVNLGVSACRADVVLLMNNDVEFSAPGQIEELLRHALRPEVGVVGCHLRYSDGALQHAGMVFATSASHGFIPKHVLRGASPDSSDYLLLRRTIRNYQAVTGAVTAIRREVFTLLGGYDEVFLPVEYNDVDFCLRVRKAGFRVISLPLEGVFHKEAASRGHDESASALKMREEAIAVMVARWPEAPKHDPYVNPWVELGDRAEAEFAWSVKREISP